MRRQPFAFTLVELLVVIAIIGVLVALLLPAIQAAREAARRAACVNNVAQLLIATMNYDSAHEMLPPGVTNPTGPIRSEKLGMHHGWLIRLLPYLDEGNAYRLVNFQASIYGPENAAVRKLSPPVFRCPSHPGDTTGQSCYAGCHNDLEAPIDETNQGSLLLNYQVRSVDVIDGMSHTILMGEKQCGPDDLGWYSGTRSTLRNAGTPINQTGPNGIYPGDPPAADAVAVVAADFTKTTVTNPAQGPTNLQTPFGSQVLASAPIQPATWVGGFGAWHAGGVAILGIADGSVRTMWNEVDRLLFLRLANRADGQIEQAIPE